MGNGPVLGEPVGEIAPLEEFHDDERRAVFQRADVEDASHVLALDLHRRSGLAHEAPRRDRGSPLLRQEQLDRDGLVELHVVGSDDDAHAPYAEDALHAVLAREHLALMQTELRQTDFGHNSGFTRESHIARWADSGPAHRAPSRARLAQLDARVTPNIQWAFA